MPRFNVPEISIERLKDIDIPTFEECLNKFIEQEGRNRDIYIICEIAKLYMENLEKKRCCGTCKRYAEFEGVCCNGDSKHRADFRCLDDTCPKWAEREDKEYDCFKIHNH